jgi:hypothetical protein
MILVRKIIRIPVTRPALVTAATRTVMVNVVTPIRVPTMPRMRVILIPAHPMAATQTEMRIATTRIPVRKIPRILAVPCTVALMSGDPAAMDVTG